MIWKIIKIEGCEWLDGAYQISEFGIVERIYPQGNIIVEPFKNSYGNYVVKLSINSILVNKMVRVDCKKLVAKHFIDIPDGFHIKKVTFKNEEFTDYAQLHHYSNLDVHFLENQVDKSKIQIEEIKLETLPKRTYKKRKPLPKRENLKTIPYYTFKDNIIYSGRTGQSAMIKNNLLAPILNLFKNKLDSDTNFIFKGLTDDEIETIHQLMPKKRFDPINRW